jgi:hypothetical protein
VSLVKELLATPRMAQHMKQHAEAILTSAREHMMQHVFSASSLTSARRLLRLSYRKLDWLRRLLSHDGKTPRVMHPAYSTIVPSLPSTPDMKADEAVMLEQGGGGSAGSWRPQVKVGCFDAFLSRTQCFCFAPWKSGS